MKLSTRLTVLLVTVTVAVAASVGWYAIAESSRANVSTLDSSINSVIASAAGHPNSALNDALKDAQLHHLDVSLDVVEASGSVLQITTGQIPLLNSPNKVNVLASLRTVTTASNLPDFRFRSVDVGNGNYLLVAASTRGITSRAHQLLLRTVLVGLIAALVMAILARLFIRRDLRTISQLIRYASDVAGGSIDSAPPTVHGSSDIRELHTALGDTVVTLARALTIEHKSAQTMQQFIGDASHELRTPLTVIKGYAELLEKNDVPEESRRSALQRIAREVDRMDNLVGDLLFLAEVHEAPTHANERLNVSAVVSDLVKDFATDFPDRQVESVITPDLFLMGRPDFLARLVANALNNIRRHTSEDAPVQVVLDESTDLVLRIDDGGPGLPDDLLGAPPERFRRFDQSRSRETGGSGLGMSIMANAARAMGGSMTTSKSALGGLSLTFSFPRGEVPTT